METDQTMQAILIAGFLVMAPVGLYHRLKSKATGEKIDRRQEGLLVLSTLRPVAMLRMLGIFTFMASPAWMAWSQVELPDAARWTGVGLMVAAGSLMVCVFRTLGKNLTDTVVTRQEHTLVTSGPYRFVRHPLYLAGFLAVLGDSLMTANWYLFGTGAVVLALIVVRTNKEEENLVARFGDDYRTYVGSTGRFFPRS